MIQLTSPPHSDPFKKLGNSNEWDSPYSWPVRREFSRILHRPRPHFGIVYTERFLNSRPLTYFDDETKLIRAKAGAILKAVHTPLPKPSKLLRPYETLDSYRSTQLIPYGVPQHIYQQSYYSDPAHLTIGRGHLACIQFAGGKGYPRRKNLYSDENRNIRDEIKFRSYYNRPKHEDPNTLPTGFAWRLLHLPPKDNKPFKLYKQSRTLPSLDSKPEKEKTIDEDKENSTNKRIHKTYTQPLEDIPQRKTERSKVYTSSREILDDKPRRNYASRKINDSLNIENTQKKEIEEVKNEEPKEIIENKVENEESFADERVTVPTDENTGAIDKKKRKKKDEDLTEKTVKRSLSHSKSITDEKSIEKNENIETEPIPKEEITEIVNTPEASEPSVKEDTCNNETEQELPATSAEESIIEEPDKEEVQHHRLDDSIQELIIENKTDNVQSEIIEPAVLDIPSEISELKETEETVLQSKSEPDPPMPEQFMQVPEAEVVTEEVVTEIEKVDAVMPPLSENISSKDEYNEAEKLEKKLDTDLDTEISYDAPKSTESVVDVESIVDEPLKTVSDGTEPIENTKLEEPENIIECNGIETSLQSTDENTGLVITEVQDESQILDQITEVSSAEITHTVYSTEETVIQAFSSTTQIPESVTPEDSDKPEDLVNETDITTDEENVEIPLE